MYVAKKPFKNFGKVYTAGTVITEPAAIKRFKGKLAEGKIIKVTEQTYEATAKYFKVKHGVDIPPITKKPEVVKKVVTEAVKQEAPKAPKPKVTEQGAVKVSATPAK